MLALDNFALFSNIIFTVGTALTIFVSTGYLRREESNRSEYYLLLLTATLGMMLMAAGTDLIVIFLGLELMSLSLYILVGFLSFAFRLQRSLSEISAAWRFCDRFPVIRDCPDLRIDRFHQPPAGWRNASAAR